PAPHPGGRSGHQDPGLGRGAHRGRARAGGPRGGAVAGQETMAANPLTSVELFTGAGGLALGTAKAGFRHAALIELDRDACDALGLNGNRSLLQAERLVEPTDVRAVDFSAHAGSLDLIA